jgi:2-polyprenyl-6-hydroxyphenyl methylase/3-demethylubiquinone-9 3-methyltransferase
VYSVDLPVTLEMDCVKRLAAECGIGLLSEPRLDEAHALDRLAADSVDVVLFTEIIEHLAFNPVNLWKQIHRVLRKKGRIIVTTPNYYACGGRAWELGRFIRGFGNGIEVREMVGLHTHAHHWKEFGLRELIQYFCLLSPDFDCTRAEHVMEYSTRYSGRPFGWLCRTLQRYLRPLRAELYLEVTLQQKDAGITATPHW